MPNIMRFGGGGSSARKTLSLYDKGTFNIISSLTNNASSYGATITLNTSYIELTTNAYRRDQHDYIVSNVPIDVSKYSFLKLVMTYFDKEAEGSYLEVGFASTKDGKTFVSSTKAGLKADVYLDISSLKGEYYFMIHIFNYSGESDGVFTTKIRFDGIVLLT